MHHRLEVGYGNKPQTSAPGGIIADLATPLIRPPLSCLTRGNEKRDSSVECTIQQTSLDRFRRCDRRAIREVATTASSFVSLFFLLKTPRPCRILLSGCCHSTRRLPTFCIEGEPGVSIRTAITPNHAHPRTPLWLP